MVAGLTASSAGVLIVNLLEARITAIPIISMKPSGDSTAIPSMKESVGHTVSNVSTHGSKRMGTLERLLEHADAKTGMANESSGSY